ncbi:uncharacterized protein METZ01_LOCUS499980 [marine metagenome]|uniref:Uncharacterized protein n=1 Tax=marine metagenome TaxID=408172 RepID=A0A383DRI1_9ZZZZ
MSEFKKFHGFPSQFLDIVLMTPDTPLKGADIILITEDVIIDVRLPV